MAAIRAFAVAVGAALILSAPAQALNSRGNSFQNLRSAIGGAGGSSSAPSYAHVDSLGTAAATELSGAGYSVRSGLIPVYFLPGRIEDLAAFGCQDRRITLRWTAPGNDGNDPGSRARSFMIRYGSDPALSPAASETLFYLGAPVAAPQPGTQGSTHTLNVSGLTNGVTYYFAILALEADLMPGPLSPGTTGSAGAGVGPPPENFVAYSGFKRSELSWTKTAALSGACVPAAYRVYRATAAASPFAAVSDTPGLNLTDAGVKAGGTYYYQLVGLDVSSVEMTAPATTYLYVRGAPPTPPLWPRLALFASSVTVSWQAPIAYDIGVPFADPSKTQSDELIGFVVWRSTALMNASWTALGQVSSATLSFTDAAPPAGAYYHVTALNSTDASQPSWTRDVASRDGYVVSPDRRSHLFVPRPALEGVFGDPAGYWVGTGSATISPQSGIYNVATWKVADKDGRRSEFYRFPSAVDIRVSYETDDAGRLQPMGASAAGVAPSAGPSAAPSQDEATLYWFNGQKFVKIYGRIDTASKWVSASTERGGIYQVRAIKRSANADFDVSNVSNRFLTPNGDGKNDNVQFIFENPRDVRISGKILDVRGRVVATLSQKTQNSMEWDGTAAGRPVPVGVYIYQLEGDGKHYNGTLVVVK